jgi:uncharacterized protein Yka (UPF0111/DUF47 family)
VLKGLLPKKTEFFAQFSRQAELAVAAARHLQTMLGDLGQSEKHAAEIHAVEHEADAVFQSTMELLHSSFVTPIERGDVHRIASQLDDILDLIEATAQKLWLYDVQSARPESVEMASHLVDATRATKATVDSLAHSPTSAAP